jgi:hypothetical protein
VLHQSRRSLDDSEASLVIDYSIHPTSGGSEMIAVLASNYCVYFYHVKKRTLTGSRLFNKRHYLAKHVKFSNIEGDKLVVYGGPNGLIVYDLRDIRHFFEEDLLT